MVGIGLALASKIFYVYVDPKIEAVEGELNRAYNIVSVPPESEVNDPAINDRDGFSCFCR